MGRRNKKLSLMSLFKKPNLKPFSSSSSPSSSSHFSWPSCNNPRTLSFRLLSNTNSEPYSDLSTDPFSFSSTTVDDSGSFSEAVMQAKKSNRLFFDTSASTKAVKKRRGVVPFKGGVAVEVDSRDLYEDFRVSMKEMMEAYGKERGGGEMSRMMEEMLAWYLKVNKKRTHEFIIRAYWDLVLEMLGYSFTVVSASCSPCNSSASSDSYHSCLSDFEEVEGS